MQTTDDTNFTDHKRDAGVIRDHGGQEGRVGRWPAVKSSELTYRLTDAPIFPNPLMIRVARVIRGPHSAL